MLKKIECLLTSSFPRSDFDSFEKGLQQLKGDDDLLKTSVDVCFRRFLTSTVCPANIDLQLCNRMIQFAIQTSRSGYCVSTLPIVLLSDMFDLFPLETCQSLFEFVEQNVHVWKEEMFFTPVRNHLLRICNDLLRRLSRTQNTVFCGRILVFLAKFFPVTERSGLNVISEFNLDNHTTFDRDVKEEAEAMPEKEAIDIEKDGKNLNVDYALYCKFWQLQDYFRNPTQCYDRLQWKVFATHSNDVFNTFQSFKLDSLSGKKKKGEDEQMQVDENEGKRYFAKYLTNQNLLHLQLSDSNFRRYILIQFLILFQYLQSSVKFKSDSEVLSDDQARWVQKTTDRIYRLIEETPPEGKKFAQSIKHILKREEQWNSWKNEGCPAFTEAKENKGKEESKKSILGVGSRKQKRRLGDQIREASASKKFLMGNKNLTLLWNLCPDNLEASSAPERDFLPSMDEYFKEAIEQLNPEEQVEEQYKKIQDGAWGWRALRLMAKKSPHFFTYGNNPITRLPEYLEQMLKKMIKDSTVTTSASLASSLEAKANGTAKSEPSNDTASGTTVCTTEALTQLAEKLEDKWSKLIPKLGLTQDNKAEFEKEATEDKDRALLMLQKWAKMEGEEATNDELLYILEGLKMRELAVGILCPKE